MLQRIRDKWTVEMGSSVDIQRIPHRILLERNLVPLREKLIPRACFLSSLSFRYGRCWSPRLGGGGGLWILQVPRFSVVSFSWRLSFFLAAGSCSGHRSSTEETENTRADGVPPLSRYTPLNAFLASLIFGKNKNTRMSCTMSCNLSDSR